MITCFMNLRINPEKIIGEQLRHSRYRSPLRFRRCWLFTGIDVGVQLTGNILDGFLRTYAVAGFIQRG